MTDQEASLLPPPSAEEQRLAACHFEYAHRATVGGDHALAVHFLRISCRLVPANFAYRVALRKAEKTRYKNNLRGSVLAPLTTVFRRARLRNAVLRKDHRKVLEHGEAILARNPWDKGAQLCMAESALALRMPVLAIWILQQAREKDGKDVRINRALARLLESQGYFSQAAALWELIRKAAPKDLEARDKAKQLAATETIARGNYEEATGVTAPGALTDTGMRAALKGQTPPPETRKLTPAKVRAEEEETTLRSRLEGDPRNTDRYLQLAGLHSRNGQFEEARAVLERGLETVGPVFELARPLADLDIEPLRRDLARIEEELRDAGGHDEKRERRRGELLAEINVLELPLFRLQVEHDPSDKRNHYELGVRLLRAGQAEEAIGELQAARSEPRLRWKALLQLGHCFEARANWPLAKRNFEDALQNMPDGAQAERKELLFHLARGHAEAGDLERAIELALDLANLDYAYRNIGRLLEEWQTRMQNAGKSAKPARR
jgi:tetratricopeptide (TPR) repeat protein